MIDKIMELGFAGLILLGAGGALSLYDIQIIISIVSTVLGFVLAILIPFIYKVKKEVAKNKKEQQEKENKDHGSNN